MSVGRVNVRRVSGGSIDGGGVAWREVRERYWEG